MVHLGRLVHRRIGSRFGRYAAMVCSIGASGPCRVTLATMTAAHRSLLLTLVALAGGCEYVAGIGLLANEYRKEAAEEADRLEQCGECPEGQRCNILLDPGRCRPDPGAEGDPCGEWKNSRKPEHQFGCAEPLVCNQLLEPDTCAKPGPIGTACYHSGHCDMQGWCDEDTCVATLPLGAACDDDEACRPNTCLDATSTCALLRAIGEACSSAQDCTLLLACSDEGRCYDHAATLPP
jgi:hypothetical protein